MFRNREVQRALDGLGFRLGMQRSLGELDLGRVQLKVFVGSLGRCRHGIAPCRRQYIIYVHISNIYVHSMEALNLDTPSSQPRRFCHIVAGVYTPGRHH